MKSNVVRSLQGVARRVSAATLLITSALASHANATWSILIVDTRTGEIAIASATCVERINLQRDTPVLITGIGAVTAQSALDASGTNRRIIRDRLLEGVPLGSIFDELSQVDAGHANRQYGMIDVSGDALTYSGTQNAQWAGGETGRIEMGEPGPADDLVYSVQGNILSGPNVVQAAIDAIIATPGDLPEKLMAGMLAARFDGGDGRCSCNINNPTGCGSPPPAPFKSAHVGYMLGARLDDMDAARVRYTISGRATGFAFPDLDDNGVADIACSWTTGTQIKLFENPTVPGTPLTFARELDGIEIGASDHRGFAICDLNNDGNEDFAIAANNPRSVVAILGDGKGGFSAPISVAIDNTPTGFASASLDASGADQLVVAVGTSNQVHTIELNAEETALEIISTSEISGSPRGITLAHLDGDAHLDLAATQRNEDTIWIGSGDGSGGFVHTQTIADHNQTVAIASADLNNDARADLVSVSDAGSRAGIYLHNADHSFSATPPIELGADGNGITIGDVTGDSIADLIVMTDATLQMQVFAGDNNGAFTPHFAIRIGGGAVLTALADLNNNGTLDVYTSATTNGSLSILDNLGDGTFPPSNGYAMGNYFLTLNIADQRLNDPDPVDQLSVLFEQWETSKIGVVDAVQSTTSSPSRVETSGTFEINVDLRDRSQTPIDAGAVQIDALSEGDLVSIDSITQTGAHTFTLSMSAETSPGTDKIIIRAQMGNDRVRIMPDTTVRVLTNIADFDGNGELDIFDVYSFLSAYNAGDPATDLSGSGTLEPQDVTLFVQRFLNG